MLLLRRWRLLMCLITAEHCKILRCGVMSTGRNVYSKGCMRLVQCLYRCTVASDKAMYHAANQAQTAFATLIVGNLLLLANHEHAISVIQPCKRTVRLLHQNMARSLSGSALPSSELLQICSPAKRMTDPHSLNQKTAVHQLLATHRLRLQHVVYFTSLCGRFDTQAIPCNSSRCSSDPLHCLLYLCGFLRSRVSCTWSSSVQSEHLQPASELF